MDRRDALKNMGAALGYSVATPTLISLMQACKSETSIDWAPEFFSVDEGKILLQLVDLILPASDTPSASDVDVHRFIDRFAAEVMLSDQQAYWRMVMGVFVNDIYESAGKEMGDDLAVDELEPALASALQFTKEQEEEYNTHIQEYLVKMAEGEMGSLDDAAAKYSFATNLRGITIWAYKTSEYVGEQVLPYLPVPGVYVACDDLEELSGGKTWSPAR